LLEGQLVDWLGQPAAARELLLRSVELARNDPRARLVLARWAKLTGDAELSKATLVEVVALDRSTYSIAAAMLVDELNDVPLAVELAGDQTDRLHSLLTVVRRRPELADLSQQIGQELTSRLEADAASGAASASQFASLAQQAALRGDATGAIDLYRNALASDYANVAWRLALAEQLMADAQHDAAMREVRICLRLSPANKQALAMAEALALLVEP
jgi:Tfp pilus assembly protein PilF